MRGDGNSINDAVDPADFLFEVPDELAAGWVTRKASAVLQKHGDARRKERLIMRRNQPHMLRELAY